MNTTVDIKMNPMITVPIPIPPFHESHSFYIFMIETIYIPFNKNIFISLLELVYTNFD